MMNAEIDEIDIISAEYLDGYRIRLAYSDGYQNVVDLGPFMKTCGQPAVRKYLAVELFRQFKIMGGGLDWNDYEMCYSTEDLYNNTIVKKR